MLEDQQPQKTNLPNQNNGQTASRLFDALKLVVLALPLVPIYGTKQNKPSNSAPKSAQVSITNTAATPTPWDKFAGEDESYKDKQYEEKIRAEMKSTRGDGFYIDNDLPPPTKPIYPELSKYMDKAEELKLAIKTAEGKTDKVSKTLQDYQHMVETARTMSSDLAKVELVNDWINTAIKYDYDKRDHKRAYLAKHKVWDETALEILASRKDVCVDYADLKYSTLLLVGLKPSNIRVLYGEAMWVGAKENRDHAVDGLNLPGIEGVMEQDGIHPAAEFFNKEFALKTSTGIDGTNNYNTYKVKHTGHKTYAVSEYVDQNSKGVDEIKNVFPRMSDGDKLKYADAMTDVTLETMSKHRVAKSNPDVTKSVVPLKPRVPKIGK